MPQNGPIMRVHLQEARDPAALEEASGEVLRMFLRAAADDSGDAGREVDERLASMAEAADRIAVAVAGRLAGDDGFADVHFPLPDGGTLTIGLSRRRPLPPIFMSPDSNPRGCDGGVPTYGTTGTVNSGMPDEKGDTD